MKYSLIGLNSLKVRLHSFLFAIKAKRKEIGIGLVVVVGWAVIGVVVLAVFKGFLEEDKDKDKEGETIGTFISGEAGGANDEFGAFDGVFAEDGSWYLAGDNRLAGGQDFRLVKLDANTNLDKNFGRGGIIQTDFGGTGDYATKMIVGKDGKITLAGATNVNGDEDFALARFDTKGDLDSSFGDGGKVIVDFNKGDDRATAIMGLDNGQIIVGGSSKNGNTKEDFALIRFNIDGSVDKRFGNEGKVTLDFAKDADWILGLGKGENGEIIAAGNSRIGNIALARFKSDGSLDKDFASDGMIKVAVDGGTGDMVIDHKQRIIVSGGTSDGKLVMVRFLANGQLDASFGNGGIVKDDTGIVIALAVDKNNKIISAGEKENFQENDQRDIFLIGFLENGNIDTSFGEKGKIIADFDMVLNFVIAMKLEQDGKIKVIGTTDKAGFTKHGLITILDRKKVDKFKFNLEDWKY